MGRINVSRSAAVRVLTLVLNEKKFLENALEQVLSEQPDVHRNWLRDVCTGVVRWKSRLDHIVDAYASKKKPTGRLRKTLLIGAYQLLFQDPEKGPLVVSETVEEIKTHSGAAVGGFANVLLKKIFQEREKWKDESAPSGVPLYDWYSFSKWLWEKLVLEKGEDWLLEYAKASLELPKVWLSSWKDLSWAEKGPIEGSYWTLRGGAVRDYPGYAEGNYFIQDISSQYLVSEVVQEVKMQAGGRPIRALDFCAAPGGKTFGMIRKGWEVTAWDVSKKRMARLKESAERLRTIEGKLHIASELPGDSLFDLVWVDAPCTGVGTLRRHPEIRWNLQSKTVGVLATKQREILQLAQKKLKPGGFMVYSVCSVLEEEGKQVFSSGQKSWALAPHVEPFGDGFWASICKS